MRRPIPHRGRTAEEALLVICDEDLAEITHPFWWDCNATHGFVETQGDWAVIVHQCQTHFSRQGGITHNKLLNAKGIPPSASEDEGGLWSFGFRSEHLSGAITLRQFLAAYKAPEKA